MSVLRQNIRVHVLVAKAIVNVLLEWLNYVPSASLRYSFRETHFLFLFQILFVGRNATTIRSIEITILLNSCVTLLLWYDLDKIRVHFCSWSCGICENTLQCIWQWWFPHFFTFLYTILIQTDVSLRYSSCKLQPQVSSFSALHSARQSFSSTLPIYIYISFFSMFITRLFKNFASVTSIVSKYRTMDVIRTPFKTVFAKVLFALVPYHHSSFPKYFFYLLNRNLVTHNIYSFYIKASRATWDQYQVVGCSSIQQTSLHITV